MKNLLAASDLTALSDRAIERAVRIAAQFDARLTVVHIVDEALPDELRSHLGADAAKVMRDQLAGAMSGQSVQTDVKIVEGEAFAQIIGAARAVAADTIVLGMHRKQGVKELFVGTTVERVLRHSDRPVLVVKDRPNSSLRAGIDSGRFLHSIAPGARRGMRARAGRRLSRGAQL